MKKRTQMYIAVLALIAAIVIALMRSGAMTMSLGSFSERDVAIFGATLLGIAIQAVYGPLLKREKFNWISLALALIVAPLVFYNVFAEMISGAGMPSWANLGLAFENGFFWNAIFAAIRLDGGGGED
jgi:hypothetical protein